MNLENSLKLWNQKIKQACVSRYAHVTCNMFFQRLWWSVKGLLATRIPGCVYGHTQFLIMEMDALLFNPATVIGEPLSRASSFWPEWNGGLPRDGLGLGGLAGSWDRALLLCFTDSTLNTKVCPVLGGLWFWPSQPTSYHDCKSRTDDVVPAPFSWEINLFCQERNLLL